MRVELKVQQFLLNTNIDALHYVELHVHMYIQCSISRENFYLLSLCFYNEGASYDVKALLHEFSECKLM